MQNLLSHTLTALAAWLRPKAMRRALAGGQWSGSSYVDSYKRTRQPSANDLLAELKNTAWSCASINASVCAAYPPSLYAITHHNQHKPKCSTRPISPKTFERFKHNPTLAARVKSAATIEEVTDHPLLTLLSQVNPIHNQFDLWELTTLYQEVTGSAYWFLDFDDALGIPANIWILPSQNVTPMQKPGSGNLIDYYLYRSGQARQEFAPDQIIHFRYPDPRNPYTAGMSPLRACFEQVDLLSEFAAFKRAKFHNHALPDAILAPDEVIGEEERDRLETQWNNRLRRGGAGRVIVTESPFKLQLLAHSMGDLASLADYGKTKEDVANAFHVPISYLTSQTNLANLQAAQLQHMTLAIAPRLQRRDEKMNEQLVPLYDPTGRLFVASEDPTPSDASSLAAVQKLHLQAGVITINEVRSELGLPPVAWGDKPWLNANLIQPGD